jgi:hypothetical protein
MRLSQEELSEVREFLRRNPVFDSFSALARAATLQFIGQGGTLHLTPIEAPQRKSRPSFLWDYDLDENQARAILAQPGWPPSKLWLVGRILAQARSEEALDYLTVDDIRLALPRLRLPEAARKRWAYATERWSRHG